MFFHSNVLKLTIYLHFVRPIRSLKFLHRDDYKLNIFMLIEKTITAPKIKLFIRDFFFNKCDQICRKLRIWSDLLEKCLIKNFIFCAVNVLRDCSHHKVKSNNHTLIPIYTHTHTHTHTHTKIHTENG